MERKKGLVKDHKSKEENHPAEPIEGLNLSEKIRVWILIVLHVVGLIGYSLPDYRPLFQMITPIHLLVISIVLLFEKSILNKSFALFFALAFFIGFGAEVFGVKSGLLFGYYQYSNVLGFKLLDVPISIGLLWAATAYAANEVVNKMLNGVVIKVIATALIMVLFDFVLEPFAVHAGLWQWNSATIPNYNYASWFGVGLILSIIYQNTVKIKFNKVTPYFLLVQVLFFLAYQLVNGLILFSLFE